MSWVKELIVVLVGLTVITFIFLAYQASQEASFYYVDADVVLKEGMDARKNGVNVNPYKDKKGFGMQEMLWEQGRGKR